MRQQRHVTGFQRHAARTNLPGKRTLHGGLYDELVQKCGEVDSFASFVRLLCLLPGLAALG